MNNVQSSSKNVGIELSLKGLVEKAVSHKYLFLLSLLLCLGIAYAYIKVSTPVYEIGTSLLIDPTGKSRQLGDSKLMDGGVAVLDAEKNISNEVGILKSYGLIEQTVRELKFDVSYHTKQGFREQEHYGYFPFVVEPDYSQPQLYGAPFEIDILTDSTYRLSIEAKEFSVSNPKTGTTHEVKIPLKASSVNVFGQPVHHNYFNFTVNKPDYEVVMANFAGQELFFKVHQFGSISNHYLGNLEIIQQDLEGTILDLNTKGEVPGKEIDFLSKLTENYIESRLSERDKIALNKEEFIRKQLASISDSLALAERNLENFRRYSGSVDLSQSASNALNQVQDLTAQQSQMEVNINYYRSQLSNLRDSSSIDKIIAPSVVGINDPLLNENLVELKRLYSEKTRMAFTKGRQSLDLELLNKQIENNTSSLEENLKNVIQSSQLSLQNINSRLNNQESVINLLPSNEKQLLKYQRKSTLYENLFNYLSQELAKTGIAKAEDISDTKILDEARIVSNGPVSPKKSLIMGMAFILGLTLPLGWVILHDTIDETIHSIDELEAHADFPVAASIAKDDSHSMLSVTHLSEWRVEESFRDLTASIQFLVQDSTKNVIGITSTIPGEGKTFCSINLSVNFAKAGKKILLIDSDFRKPSLLEIPVNGKKKKHFADYLMSKNGSLKSVIQRHPEFPNFHYISTRVEERNPQVLLSSPRFQAMLETLKEQYDYIIIDSPAIGLVSDYLLMSKFIDVHLFIVRRKVSKISFLKNLKKLKKSGQVKNVYLIFNGARGKSFKYGYSRYDYSGKSDFRERFQLKKIKNWLF